MNFAVSVLAGVLCLFALPSCGQKSSHSKLGEAHARQQVQRVISAAAQTPFYKPLLPTKAVATAMMEPLLFSIYGKENIIRQRPYEVYLINGFWYLAGTLPEDMLGGTFELIVEAQNGRVVELTHGK
ncbi:hypothetical protein CDA63_19245 [Hymenobacter amundsenii]|uniref:NTF2 fold domain-containing protein n=1 Tax=Hymenobacter amundsenii TaxID=2006685 RepID=A0A246FFZ7_9BACT|nr:NTF2 fold immunity protein [Hymenobacter amundsenii]OWP61463.1 hypothetical protein CDA63_19245 [Hymenobacter amundsenii]